MLTRHCMAARAGAKSVRATGPAVEGDLGDITIAYDRTEVRKGGARIHAELTMVPQGEAALTSLRESLRAEYKRVDNSHWGTETHVRHVVQALKIGFLILLLACRTAAASV